MLFGDSNDSKLDKVEFLVYRGLEVLKVAQKELKVK